MNSIRVLDIEKALRLSERAGWGFNDTSFSRTSLIQLCRRLNEHSGSIRLLELGGGQSTIFWWALRKLRLLQLEVTTLEHQKDWVDELQWRVGTEDQIKVVAQTLKQISEDDWERMFMNPMEAASVWSAIGVSVSKREWYGIQNCFYAEADQLGLQPHSIDVLLLDGPHLGGRSLAFPIFYQVLKPNAYILLDDFDHYPYLEDLERVFHYEELYREVIGGKRAVLLQLQGISNGGASLSNFASADRS